MNKEEIKQEMKIWEKYFNEVKKLLKQDEYKYSYCYMQYQKYRQMYEEFNENYKDFEKMYGEYKKENDEYKNNPREYIRKYYELDVNSIYKHRKER